MITLNEIPFTAGKQYSPEEICITLRSAGFHPAMVDRANTSSVWQPVLGAAEQDKVLTNFLFWEKGSKRILYLAIDHRTVMFSVYDCIHHAMDCRPILRIQVAALTTFFALNAEWRESQEKAEEEGYEENSVDD